MGTAGMATAFKAELGGKSSKRPRVAILAEYDALPGLGHGCGHNLIGTSAIGAGLALSEVIPDLEGSVWVLGTPAEESAAPNSGGKVHMVNAGIFSDVDAAIMFHPGTETAVTLDRSLAARGFEFYFHGRAAHAAGAPEDGINALDAVVLLYNAISMLRQQMRSDVRIHGIILSGARRPTSSPTTRPSAIDARRRLRLPRGGCPAGDRVRRGRAKATGCRLEWTEYMPGYENTMPNKVLLDLMTSNMRALGSLLITSGAAVARLHGFRQRLAAGARHRSASGDHRRLGDPRPLDRVPRGRRLRPRPPSDAQCGQVAGHDHHRPAQRTRTPQRAREVFEEDVRKSKKR